jgi:hypothetical protein
MFLTERSEAEPIDKVDHLTQGPVDEGTVASDLADAEFGTLPHIMTVGFRDRYIELVSYAILDRPQDLAFALKRMILRQEQGKPYDADYHFAGSSRIDVRVE